jgi:anti-anti-sigma factor
MGFWNRKPNVDCREVGGWTLIDITTDVSLESSLSFLYALVRRLLKRGARRIALRFTRESFLDSKALAYLVRSWEAIRSTGGTLVVVSPNEQMAAMVRMLNLHEEIRFVPSLEALEK